MIISGRRLLQVFIIIVLVCSIGFNINSYRKNHQLSKKYEGLMCIAMELQDANLISFVTAMNVPGSEYNKIEIFSVDEGEIIKRVETNPMIQDEVKSYINGVTGLYGRIRAFPVGGYIIRIPLEPPEKVENYWLNDFGITSINQVFILFPKEERPYLLVLDNNRRPIFCNFNGKTDKLLEYLDFQLDE